MAETRLVILPPSVAIQATSPPRGRKCCRRKGIAEKLARPPDEAAATGWAAQSEPFIKLILMESTSATGRSMSSSKSPGHIDKIPVEPGVLREFRVKRSSQHVTFLNRHRASSGIRSQHLYCLTQNHHLWRPYEDGTKIRLTQAGNWERLLQSCRPAGRRRCAGLQSPLAQEAPACFPPACQTALSSPHRYPKPACPSAPPR